MNRTHKPYSMLKAVMIELGVKNIDLASLLDITDVSVRNKISGKSDFTLGEAETICRTYSLPISIFFESPLS